MAELVTIPKYVMISYHLLVGVEPLGHFHSRNRGISSGHGEINIESNLTTIPAISRWNSAEHSSGVEHLVVVREGVARDVFDPSISHLLPDGFPEISCNFLQILGTALAIPERFQCKLELSLGAHTRISNNV